MTETIVRNNVDQHRYEALIGGDVAGFAQYMLTPELIVFTHTEVDPSHEGQGVGSALARFALDEVRDRAEVKVMPLCPFIKAWILKHSDYQDLMFNQPPSRVVD